MKLEFIKKLDKGRGLMELYRRGDEYIVISTITDEQRPKDPVQSTFINVVGAFAAAEGVELPSEGEETLAFEADKDGYVTHHYPHLAAAFGDGSRDKVMKELQEE